MNNLLSLHKSNQLSYIEKVVYFEKRKIYFAEEYKIALIAVSASFGQFYKLTETGFNNRVFQNKALKRSIWKKIFNHVSQQQSRGFRDAGPLKMSITGPVTMVAAQVKRPQHSSLVSSGEWMSNYNLNLF